MSTYLVAFVVSDLECLTSTSASKLPNSSNKTILVCAQSEQKETGKYALEVTPKILSFYEEHFGIEFPLPKIHLVAIPDFCCGAMVSFLPLTKKERKKEIQNRT